MFVSQFSHHMFRLFFSQYLFSSFSPSFPPYSDSRVAKAEVEIQQLKDENRTVQQQDAKNGKR